MSASVKRLFCSGISKLSSSSFSSSSAAAAVAAGAEAKKGSLSGVRVLDLSRILAGPFCTQLLGDKGADVIKVERPLSGDDTRQWGPPFVGEQSAYFLCCNRNKRSIAIDFQKPQGQQLIRDIIKSCDVLVENYLPNKLQQFGLDYASLHAINPRLIYASISGYGQSGPKAQRAGFDVIVSAVGGLMGATGSPGGPPVKTAVALTDICTGLVLEGSICSALYARERSGKGQRICTSLLETQVACMANLASSFLNSSNPSNDIATPMGTAHASIVPYQAFKTADGYAVIGAGNDKQFERVVKAIGLPELSDNELYKTNANRVKNRETLIDTMEKKTKEMSTAEVEEVVNVNGCPCGPVNTIDKVFEDRQVKHLDMVHNVEGYRVMRAPVNFSETPTSIRRAPPLLGQHTQEILLSFAGKNRADIEELRSLGVIQ